MIMDNSKIAMTTEQKWKLPFLLIVIGQSISLIGSSAVQFAFGGLPAKQIPHCSWGYLVW